MAATQRKENTYWRPEFLDKNWKAGIFWDNSHLQLRLLWLFLACYLCVCYCGYLLLQLWFIGSYEFINLLPFLEEKEGWSCFDIPGWAKFLNQIKTTNSEPELSKLSDYYRKTIQQTLLSYECLYRITNFKSCSFISQTLGLQKNYLK